MSASDSRAPKQGYPRFLEPIIQDTDQNPVVLYTKDKCEESKKARGVLKSEKINFVEKNVDTLTKEDAKKGKDYALGLRVITQSRVYPQLFVCGDLVGDLAELEKTKTSLKEMVSQCAGIRKKRKEEAAKKSVLDPL
ncbi:unnamed protein product, partial [Mesorhabditis spiculigera]